jgi:hypothetical protein
MGKLSSYIMAQASYLNATFVLDEHAYSYTNAACLAENQQITYAV